MLGNFIYFFFFFYWVHSIMKRLKCSCAHSFVFPSGRLAEFIAEFFTKKWREKQKSTVWAGIELWIAQCINIDSAYVGPFNYITYKHISSPPSTDASMPHTDILCVCVCVCYHRQFLLRFNIDSFHLFSTAIYGFEQSLVGSFFAWQFFIKCSKIKMKYNIDSLKFWASDTKRAVQQR